MFLVFVFFDTVQGIASSAIKASGRQRMGAIVTTLAYFGLGIPLTVLCCFVGDMGIMGIWVGPSVACCFNACAYLTIYSLTNWPQLIARAALKREEAKGN